MEVYSIGFTQKTAEQFFTLLRGAGIRRLLDVRLNNVSQLAGFTKRDDLQFFLREVCGADYRHEPLLAPTQEILDEYKKNKGSWLDYEMKFMALIADRKIETRSTAPCSRFPRCCFAASPPRSTVIAGWCSSTCAISGAI